MIQSTFDPTQRRQIELPVEEFRQKLLRWAARFYHCAFYDSCSSTLDQYGEFEIVVGVAGADAEIVNSLGSLINGDWAFGYVSYDYKNELEERLHSNGRHTIEADPVRFFRPDVVVLKRRDSNDLEIISDDDVDAVFEAILSTSVTAAERQSLTWKSNFDQDEYVEVIENIRNDIREGEIYEMNLCREFVCDDAQMDAVGTWEKLRMNSPVPYSAFIRMGEKYVLSASPERFLKHESGKLYTQPIKGTIRRGANEEEDKELAKELLNSEKDRAENVMIVDLARNDLYRSCKVNSVKVEHLFELQTFPQVHHLVSTISGELAEDVTPMKAFANAFPPGSMTGAPKFRSMELIERYERSARGVYSGAIGFIQPNGDFDFNVVIRSLIYDAGRGVASFHVGGAITWGSDPVAEFEETNLKAKAIRLTLD